MAAFKPRLTFPHLDSIPRSYFLGHHRAGLTKMASMVSSIDLVIECRDYRTPLVSRNPLFEDSLGSKPRLIVYTKQDLGSNGTGEDQRRESLIRNWDSPTPVLFASHLSRNSIQRILSFARTAASDRAAHTLTSSRMMIVGMPNVGKSTLLNTLRAISLKKGKVAHTGAQPGVTRKIGSVVKIIPSYTADPKNGVSEGVYLVDTPGVFIPYVPDAEAMLKLAVCGSVKDTIIPPTTLADYLLYHLNLHDPTIYAHYSPPTNDIFTLLSAIAHASGRLKEGGRPDEEATALWMIQMWRNGKLGRFMLDEVTADALAKRKMELEALGGSMNQAIKAAKAEKKEISRLKWEAGRGGG